MDRLTLTRALLQRGRRLGPIPDTAADFARWLPRLRAETAEVQIRLRAADPERARRLVQGFAELGLTATAVEGVLRVRFPADPEALLRCLDLLGARDLAPDNGAAAFLDALEASHDPADALPVFSLAVGVPEARAAFMGYDRPLRVLTVLITNTVVDSRRMRLTPGEGPALAVCAEFGRLLRKLSPPELADWSLEESRERGIPRLKLPWRGLHLQERPGAAGGTHGRHRAVAEARAFLDRIDDAWNGGIATTVEIGWPVYPAAAANAGLLDAVAGTHLPPLPAIYSQRRIA